ncbi:hypothetical protein B0H13DRAFT_1902960 [Mycena leptocephala]|nr:hypothetical protein B0H13DRAFT_1902960 [Mycena leptocephala]
MVERPYVKSDFDQLNSVGLTRRNPYIVMIERQPEKFTKGLNLSKINIPDMQKVLLDPQIGFTTNLPGEQQTSPTPDCRDNEWRASSIEIFKELQVSIGQLDGSGRIGVPDSEEPEYTEYFVTFHVDDKTETFPQNLSNIIIPDGNKPELRMDPVRNNRPRTSSPVLPSPWTRELPGFGRRLKSTQGIQNFILTEGKVLQNPDRVESWKFAAQVTSTFQKPSWPTEISSTTIISKTAIERALGISTTSLNEAINMTRIITIYGCDGPNRNAEVIAEVTKIQQADALGASALKSSFNHGPMTILLSIIKLESCTRPMFIIFYH